ncbi:MAG: hypothetical protein SGARI_001066 [Bacillariaceae sp.]
MSDQQPGTVRIYVDLKNPERNGPVYVYTTKGIVATNKVKDSSGTLRKEYDGYCIILPFDQRWVEDSDTTDFFKATLSSTDTVVVEHINYDYDIYHFPESFDDDLGEEVYRSMDVARNDFREEHQSRLLSKTILHFPTPHDSEKRQIELTVEPICDEDDNTTLPFDVFDVTHAHTKLGNFNKHFCAFWVCRDDIRSTKRGKPDPSTVTKLSKAKQKMQARAAAKQAMKEESG